MAPVFSRACALFSSACLAALLCAPAGAGEAEAQWTGLYVGVHAGSASGQIDDIDNQTQARNTFSLGANSFESASWFGGAQFGYNHQFDHVVVGTEFSASDGGASDPEVCFPNAVLFTGTNTFTCEADLNWKGSWAARLGIAFGSEDRFLGYATGGVTMAEYNVSKFQTNSAVVGPPFGTQDTTTAWSGAATFVGGTLGAGLQYAISRDVSFGVEYAHSEYASSNYTTQGTQHIVCSTLNCGPPFALAPRTASDQLSDDAVRVVLNLRLD